MSKPKIAHPPRIILPSVVLPHDDEPVDHHLRSPRWADFEKHLIEAHPFCSVCGFREHLLGHHKIPFHLRPDLELVAENIAIVGNKCPTGNCHLLFGHFGNFKAYNPNFDADAAAMLAKIHSRPTTYPIVGAT